MMGIIQTLTKTVLPVFLTILEKVFKIIGPLIEGVAKVVGSVAKVAGGAVSKVTGFIGGIFGGNKNKGKATGGYIADTDEYMVGEDRPERVILPRGAQVKPGRGKQEKGMVVNFMTQKSLIKETGVN